MLELAIVFLVMHHIKRKQQPPVVTLTKDGIEIHALLQHTGLVRWDEIDEIGAFTALERCVGIVPKNAEALCDRLPPYQAFWIRTNSRFCRMFPKHMRKVMAPITLSQQTLPMSPDDLIARIDKFRRENAI